MTGQFVFIVGELMKNGAMIIEDVCSTKKKADAAKARLRDQGIDNLRIFCWQVNGYEVPHAAI